VQISRPTQALLNTLAIVGLSRQAALPVARRVSQSRAGSIARKVVGLALGSSLIGVAVALLVNAELGMPPYDVLSSGIQSHTTLTLGQSSWLISGVLFMTAALLGRFPSVWGLSYVFLNGIAIDAAIGLVNAPDLLIVRWGFVVAAAALISIAISIVVYSGTTGGSFELLMLAGEDRGVSRIKVRYALDIGIFALGLILGGKFGVATIVHAATIGVLLRTISQVLLDYERGRNARMQEQLDARPLVRAAAVRK